VSWRQPGSRESWFPVPLYRETYVVIMLLSCGHCVTEPDLPPPWGASPCPSCGQGLRRQVTELRQVPVREILAPSRGRPR